MTESLPRPTAPSERVRALLAAMTLEEKLAQLVGFWVDKGDELVAPMAGEMGNPGAYADATAHGLGQLTRVYGTRPVDPAERAAWLWARAAPAEGGDAPRHPGARARGVPDRARRVEGRHVPDAARLGRLLRPGARGGDGRPDRRARCASSASTRASPRCST